MRVKYDPETGTLSIRLKDEPVAESEYIEDKGIVVDYNEKNEVVGYEVMGWSRFQRAGRELVVESVNSQVKMCLFICSPVPRFCAFCSCSSVLVPVPVPGGRSKTVTETEGF